MKHLLLTSVLWGSALAMVAQTWTEPAVPGEDLTTLKSSEIVYFYNVDADAFLMYGMTNNNQACAARLTNGDYNSTIPNQSYAFVADGKVKVRNKERGNSYYVSCPTETANDVVINRNQNADFTYTETAEGSSVYTLNNVTFGKNLDVSWTYGGHLTLVDGSGQTKWAFIKEGNVTNGQYAVYKAKRLMYGVYKALADAGKTDAYAAALSDAYEVYADANATVESITAASRKLFKSVCADITSPLNVSFMLDNADMVGNASAAKWYTGNPAFGWEEFEIYHSAFTLEQDGVLPLGTYDLAFHSLYREDGSGTAPTLTVTTGKGTYTGKTPLMGTIDYDVTNTTDNNWTSAGGKIQPNGMQSCGQALAHGDAVAWVRDIAVDAEGAVNIKYVVSTGNQWVNWQGFKLFYKGLSKEELMVSLKSTIDEATSLYGDGSGKGADALKATVDASSAVYSDADATNTELKGAIDALVLAMKNYRYGNASEENPIDMTNLIVNPSFEQKTEGWTVEGLVSQTNTSFTQKKGSTYLEKWTGAGGRIGDASVMQTIVGLDKGIYQLKVGAQNIQQNSSATQSGAWIVANDSKVDVSKTADYTLTFTNIENDVTIGFLADDATGNWLSVDNFRLYYVGGTDADYKTELQRYLDNALALADKKMHTAAKQTLDAAIAAVQSELQKTSTDGYSKVSTPLREAADEAEKSIKAYAELLAAIEKAKTQYGDGNGEGAAEYLAAIQAAEAAYADGATTYADLANHIVLLDEAAFAFMLQSPTGAIPTITKTDKRYARGSVMAFGRFTYNLNGSKLREAGFCYSTEKNPTVLDQRSTRYLDNNGRIYVMENMQPSTVYYARPYVVTDSYQVAYGDEIKIVTIPKGGMTWSWNFGGSAEENDRIYAAMDYGMFVWNNLMSIQGFHLTGNYGSGTPTADCSYGGWMRVGPNPSYQRTGTIMHEAAHGVGVGTHWTWGTIMQGGTWTGPRANSVLQFWNNNTTEEMHGDGTHMWPYGINGAHEDNGSDLLYYGNALIIQGLHEDGLSPTNGCFASAAYTFEHDDEVKYYIKSESEAHGLTTSYLTVNGTALTWQTASSADVVADDAYAWYLSFDPKTQFYTFRNASTNQCITYSGSAFKLVDRANPTAAEKFQLMLGRKNVKVGSGTSAINVRGYWVLKANGGSATAMTAATSGKVSATNFDISAEAATQHWVILTAEETTQFDAAARQSALNELKSLISNLNKTKATPHTEDTEGADAAIDVALADAQTVADNADSDLETILTTIDATRQSGMDFLASVTPQSIDTPFDITFLIKNASIDNNTGWSVQPVFNHSCLEFYQTTFDFNQTLTNLPAGTYQVRVQAFQRPGSYTTAYSDYVAGTDKVSTYLYANSASVKVKHIATEARTTKLGGTEASVGSPVRYIPDNMEAASKYFAKGLYDNELTTQLTSSSRSLKIGLRCSSSSDGYWSIFDNFRLYYFGDHSKDDVTGVEGIETANPTDANLPVYSLQGQRMGNTLEGLPRGIYIRGGKKILVK